MDRVQEAAGEPLHSGLGTSIVEALAHQLKATVEKTSGLRHPGLNYCPRSQLEAEMHMALMSLWVISGR